MRVSSGSDPKVEEESSYSHIEEVSLEAEALGNEAFEELLKCKTLELEAMEAFSKVTTLQYSRFISRSGL